MRPCHDVWTSTAASDDATAKHSRCKTSGMLSDFTSAQTGFGGSIGTSGPAHVESSPTG
jgi:hypothetical protein